MDWHSRKMISAESLSEDYALFSSDVELYLCGSLLQSPDVSVLSRSGMLVGGLLLRLQAAPVRLYVPSIPQYLRCPGVVWRQFSTSKWRFTSIDTWHTFLLRWIQCPDDDTLLDGSVCPQSHGTCFHGQCVGAEQQCVDLWGAGQSEIKFHWDG